MMHLLEKAGLGIMMSMIYFGLLEQTIFRDRMLFVFGLALFLIFNFNIKNHNKGGKKSNGYRKTN